MCEEGQETTFLFTCIWSIWTALLKMGLGANISENTVVQTSLSLKNLMNIGAHFDTICKIPSCSLHHTSKPTDNDLKVLLEELVTKNKVFDYVPGCMHHSFKSLQPHWCRQDVTLDSRVIRKRLVTILNSKITPFKLYTQ